MKLLKSKILLFLSGVLIVLFVLPLLQYMGVPSYAVILESIFGDQKVFGLLFTALLLSVIVFGLYKYEKKTSKI